MSNCIHCNKSRNDYPFRVIEIQTLHVRDISGEKYVQAKGKTADFSVCQDCAEKYLSSVSSFGSELVRKILPFALVAVFGVLCTIFLKSDLMYIRMLGPIAILCGIIGIVVKTRDLRSRKKTFEGYSKEKALQQAAWNVLIESLPKKNGDQDITYVPVSGDTKKMNLKELALAYDLIPAIAKQVKAEIAGSQH